MAKPWTWSLETLVRAIPRCIFFIVAFCAVALNRAQAVGPTVQFSSGTSSANVVSGSAQIQVSVTSVSSLTGTYASGFDQPGGLATDSSGNLYVANTGANTVSKITPAGAVTTFVPSTAGLSSPQGLVCDSTGNLYVASSGNNKIFKVTSTGTVSTLVSVGLNSPQGLAFSTAGSTLYIANGGAGTVSTVTSTGANLTTFASGLGSPSGLVFDSGSDLYITNKTGGSLLVVPFGSSSATLLTTGLTSPSYIAYDSNTKNLFVSNNTATGTITKVVVAGTTFISKSTFATGLISPAGLNIDSSGDFFIANNSASTTAGSVTVYSGVKVPFTVTGGTAVSGTDYSAVSASPLSISFNGSTANLVVILVSDPGAAKTMIFSLGTPIVALNVTAPALGTITTNTLTITDPFLVVQGPTGTALKSGSASIDFGNCLAGAAAPLTFTLQNAGPNTVAISSITFSGSDPNDFTVTTPPASSLGAGTSTPMVVSFTPTDSGTRTATMTIASNDPSAPSFTISLQGEAGAAVRFSAAAETVNAPVGSFSFQATLAGTPVSSIASLGATITRAVALDASGNIYVANPASFDVLKVTPQGAVSTFVSFPGILSPFMLAVDPSGNLFVGQDTAIYKVTSTGSASPFVTGTFGTGMVCDGSGNLYVSSTNSILKFTALGAQSTFFTKSGFHPGGLAFDAAGNLYAADATNNNVVQINAAGTSSTVFATGITSPFYLAFDGSGNLYVTASSGKVVQVTPLGATTTVLSTLNVPQGIAYDGAGNLYIADGGSLERFALSVSVPLVLGGTAVAGTDYSGVTAGPLVFPLGQNTVAISGNLMTHLGDSKTLTFTLGTPSATSVALGSPSVNTLTLVQPAMAVQEPPGTNLVSGTSTVNFGTVAISTSATQVFILQNHASTPLHITSVTTLGGNASEFAVSGAPATIAAGGSSGFAVNYNPVVFGPRSTTLVIATDDPLTPSFTVALQGSGVCLVQFSVASQSVNAATASEGVVVANLIGFRTATVSTAASGLGTAEGVVYNFNTSAFYVADAVGNTINKIDSAGHVTTFVPATAGLSSPQGMAIDVFGTLYVANAGNNTVSMVTPQGVVSTLISTGLNSPQGLALDNDGNIYIANAGDGTISRKTVSNGIATATLFASGLNQPGQIISDGDATLYVTNKGNGTVSAVPVPIGATTSTPSTLASGLGHPTGLFVDGTGNIYVADAVAGTVSRVSAGGGAPIVIASGFTQPAYLTVGPTGLFMTDSAAGTLSKLDMSIDVNFTIGGTAVAGTDYLDELGGTLNFPFGSNTQFIDIDPILHPGSSSTITLTLGATIPSGEAVLGSIAEDTVTLVQPSMVVQQPVGTTLATGASTINFGTAVTTNVPGATGVPLTFTVLNAGSTPLTLNSVTPSGTNAADFTVTTVPAGTVSAGGSTTFVVTFAPTGTGSRGATLTIAGSDPDYPTYTLNLTGAGAPAAVAFNTSGATVNANAGTFSIPVTVTGTPSSTLHTFASGFGEILSLACDASNNLCAADLNTRIVYKVTPAGVVTPFASSGTNGLTSIALDSIGNLYMSDSVGSNSGISKVTPGGQVSTFAPGVSGTLAVDHSNNVFMQQASSVIQVPPGGANQTTYVSGLTNTRGLTFDSAGNLYVLGGGSVNVYKVPPGGGSFTPMVSGQIPSADGIAIDSLGNMFVFYSNGGEVFQVFSDGSVTTYINSGLNHPTAMTFDSLNNLYIAEGRSIVELGRSLVIPYTLSGTAVSGTDYSGITTGFLVLAQGQTTATLSGTLLSDPGANKTLVVTLGTPSGLFATLGTTSTYTLTINQGAASPYASWLSSQGISGPNSGPLLSYINDGIDNLVKFAFGLSVTANSPGQVKVSGGTLVSLGMPTVALVPSGGNTVLAVTYLQSTSAASQDLTYTVQFSNDLVHWSNATQSPTTLATGSGFNAVQVLDTAPTHQFARVMVQYTGQ